MSESTTPPMQMSLYDINKQLVEGMENLTEEQLDMAVNTIVHYLSENPSHYYMLLGKENDYYTVYRITDKILTDESYKKMALDLIDLIKNDFYDIKVIESDTNGAIAFWMKMNKQKEISCYYLFAYEAGVIEV